MEHMMVLLALAGGLFSFSVMVEVLEKLGGSDSPTWSMLRMMGPQAWSPPRGDPVRVTVALAILVSSLLYFFSCCLLDKAATTKNAYLVVPWLLCEGSTILYQICASLNVLDRFTMVEASLLVLDTAMGFVAIGYVTLTALRWLQSASFRRIHQVSTEDAEARILHTYSAMFAQEERPLLKDSQQGRFCVTKIASNRVEASMLDGQAVREISGGKRVRFQTPESSPDEERKFSQVGQNKTGITFVSPLDTNHNEDRAVLTCVRGDWVVRYVKPSDAVPTNAFGFGTGQVGYRSSHSIAVDTNETNKLCSVADCDYWPCNETTLPCKSKDRKRGYIRFEPNTRSPPAENVYSEVGNCFKGLADRAKENVYDIPESTDEPVQNEVSSPNICASMMEIEDGEELISVAPCLAIQKFTPNSGPKLPDLCHNMKSYMEASRERDSFATTDIWSRNGDSSCFDDKNDIEFSTGNGQITCQEVASVSGTSSPVKIRPPGSSREANTSLWLSPESTRRLLLSGGKSLCCNLSLSEMDVVVLGPRDWVYQGALSRSPSTSTGTSSFRDSGGEVWCRVSAPGTELVRGGSWRGSFTDIDSNTFVQRIPALSCPSLASQCGSSLSQNTSELSEECMTQQASLTEYSLPVPIATRADRRHAAHSEVESDAREYNYSEHIYRKVSESDPGVETSEEDLVDLARKLDKNSQQNNLKRSEYWLAEGVDSRVLKNALNKLSSHDIACTDESEESFCQNEALFQ